MNRYEKRARAFRSLSWSPVVGLCLDALFAVLPIDDFTFLRITLTMTFFVIVLLIIAPVGWVISMRQSEVFEMNEDARKWSE